MSRVSVGVLNWLVVGAIAVAAGCSGANGTDGKTGKDGVEGDSGPAGTAGPTGATGPSGTDGPIGSTGPAGDAGATGPAGAGYLELEPAGIVGFVKDTAREPVVGATVYLVPAADIPTAALNLTDIAVAKTSTDDEPLEDPIAGKGSGYTKAVTDADGVYRVTSVPAGSYFIAVVPATTDKAHLPGGSLCRKSVASTDIVGKQWNIDVSTRPSDQAEYVGTSACLTCHGLKHEKQTLHNLGLRVMGKTGPLQDYSRFPDWNKPATTKFTAAGTTIYFYGYNGNATSPDWKASETNPGTGVSFSIKLHSAAGKYLVELSNVAGASGTKTYEATISYGGGLYKQRWVTKIGTSWYVLPLQFNFQGITTEATAPYSRWTWVQYNAQNWYDETNKALKEPSKAKSFDNNCAGCHMTGFQLSGDATNGWQARGVPDEKGEIDFDGDGMLEQINMGCETCHGPGSEHWEWAGQGRSIVSPNLLTPEREVAICSQCHSRPLGVGGGNTEAPLDANGRMFVAGKSRAEFLAQYVSKFDDGLWDATKGDGKHSKKHHQQATDFIKSGKYRNDTALLTCASCHDPHGNGNTSHQVRDKLDTASGGKGLCMSCHDANFPTGATFGAQIQAHFKAQGVADTNMGNIGCADCHMPKTAKSGSGTAGLTVSGTTYYLGDISSHLFDVPLKADVPTKASDMMALAYTNKCGVCHTTIP